MRHPRMLLPSPTRPVRKQHSTEIHPTDVFIQLLPTKDNPHDRSHAPQMDFKTHSDWKNRP